VLASIFYGALGATFGSACGTKGMLCGGFIGAILERER